MREHGYAYTIAYASNAIAWAESPSTIKGLWRQRNFWQRGLMRCLALHWKMMLNPRYGLIGLLGFPAYTVFEIFGPLIEGFAYVVALIALSVNQVHFTILTWLLFLSFSFLLLITTSCIFISSMTYKKYSSKGDLSKLILITFVELIFYRPLRGVCCLISSFHYIYNRLRGKAL